MSAAPVNLFQNSLTAIQRGVNLSTNLDLGGGEGGGIFGGGGGLLGGGGGLLGGGGSGFLSNAPSTTPSGTGASNLPWYTQVGALVLQAWSGGTSIPGLSSTALGSLGSEAGCSVKNLGLRALFIVLGLMALWAAVYLYKGSDPVFAGIQKIGKAAGKATEFASSAAA